MVERHKREGGFTLIEILIVLGLLGVLMAVVVPNLTGFLVRGQSQAYDQDRQTIQVAVDAYYTDISRGSRKYPTLDGTSAPLAATFPYANVYYIDMSRLISEGYLREAPQSSRSTSQTPLCGGNPGGRSGSYIWFVDSRGVVTSTNCAGTTGYANTYP